MFSLFKLEMESSLCMLRVILNSFLKCSFFGCWEVVEDFMVDVCGFVLGSDIVNYRLKFLGFG